ncbi:hypothetical protein B0H17DRAFT_109703 [Mycena rosella]|uniref:Uncharacterized protein n=1 Tax=Mycena rosella TaxID=1033263 RepID=A0AAD7D4H7_MYCRO|nr:hypothetical protein B0H17DRAFT_109703 [Mycena rosella]
MFVLLHGHLLPPSPQQHLRGRPRYHQEHSRPLPSLPRHIHSDRSARRHIPPSTALTGPLYTLHPALWFPNGLCSSITESKHIKAVKEPWRRSSRFNALLQMLTTISRLDKVGTTSSYTAMVHGGAQPQLTVAAIINGDDEDEDDVVTHGPKSLSSMELAHTAARGYPKELDALAVYIHQPRFPAVLRRFLYEEIHGPPPVGIVALAQCPVFRGTIDVHHSAIARFYAPSDLCGAGGMYSERI